MRKILMWLLVRPGKWGEDETSSIGEVMQSRVDFFFPDTSFFFIYLSVLSSLHKKKAEAIVCGFET